MQTLERPSVQKPIVPTTETLLPGKYRLITNIDYVEFNGMSLNCHALVLTESVSVTGERLGHGRLTGYCDDPHHEMFKLELGCDAFDYELLAVIGTRYTLFKKCTLRFKDGTEFLIAVGRGQELDVSDFTSVHSLNAMMTHNVAKYCAGTHIFLAHPVKAGNFLAKKK